MTDLAGRGPLGLKGRKEPPPLKKPWQTKRKPIPPRSKKKLAYLRSHDRKAGLLHMARVKGLPCICCGKPPPSAAHHVTGDGMPRDDMRVLPLCYGCHQGQHGYHNAKASWVSRYGPDFKLLDRVQIALANGT